MSDETGNVSLRIGRCAKLGFLRFFLTFFKLIRVKSAICLEACAHSGIMVHRVQTRGEEMLSHPENTRTHIARWIGSVCSDQFRPQRGFFVLLHWLPKRHCYWTLCGRSKRRQACYLLFCCKHKHLNSDHSLLYVWAVVDVRTCFLDGALQSALRRHIKIRHWNMEKYYDCI